LNKTNISAHADRTHDAVTCKINHHTVYIAYKGFKQFQSDPHTHSRSLTIIPFDRTYIKDIMWPWSCPLEVQCSFQC